MFISTVGKTWQNMAQSLALETSQTGADCEMHLLSLEANVRFWTQGGPEILG